MARSWKVITAAFVWLFFSFVGLTSLRVSADCDIGIIAYTGLEGNSGGESNIFTADPCTGESRQLTTDGASWMPIWAPDGTKIAFQRHMNDLDYLWVMDSDGSNLIDIGGSVYSPYFAARSPTGEYISFKAATTWGDRFQLYLVKPDGSDLHPLVTLPEGHVAYSAWSSDGTRIAFTSHWGSESEPENSIYIVNADGSNLTEVSITGELSDVLSWSPDGELIAYTVDHDLYQLSLSDLSSLRLTNGGSSYGASWSPDGQKIAFHRNGQIYVSDARNFHEMQLTGTGINGGPVWSPDGRHIAFISDEGGSVRDYRPRIYIMNANGSGQTRLTLLDDDVRQANPVWMPLISS